MTRRLRIVLCIALALSSGRIGAEDASSYKLIVNAGNPATQLTRLKVGEIFLKKAPRWPEGGQ